jgi:hypothetical protein
LLLLAGITDTSSAIAAPAAQTTSAWTGYYFANPNLQGDPVLVREDPNIDFAWGYGAPASGLSADNFSVRWVRWVFLDAPGNWTFAATTDDGVRLFVDDQLVIDAWYDQQPTAHSVTLNLTQTFHFVRMEYYDRSGNAEAHLQILSGNFPDWRGEYYSNTRFAGAPTFIRNDSAINFNFGTAGPGGGVPGQTFSVRWTRNQYFSAGRYRFTTTTDDGVRFWVDNQLLIDHWNDQVPTSWSGDITLTDGDHFVKMEYYNGGGTGLAQLLWTPISGDDIWRGEYFDSPGLAGALAFSRDDTNINFNWGTQPPGIGISQSDNWSARFTSRRTASAAGYHTVTVAADDGVRVWVDGNPVIDEWHDQSPTPYAAMVYLNPGKHDWRVEYYNHAGAAVLVVQISPGATPIIPSQSNSQPSDIAIDTRNPSFVKGGSSDDWQTAPNGYGGTAFWLKNNTYAQGQFNWARWYALLPCPGYYQVSMYIPAGIATTRNVRYWIAHAGAYDTRRVNQSLYANQWVSLGVFYFSATGGEYVSMSDVTYEPFLSTAIVVDAVKFSPR